MTRNNFKAICHLKKISALSNLVMLAVIMIGGAVLGILLGDEGIDEIAVGDLIAIMICFFYLLVNQIIKVFVHADEVPRGLCFGMTRKVLFGYSRLADFIEILIFAIAAIIFSRTISINVILKMACIVFGVIMLVEGIAGNGILRYGKTAFWVYYIVWLFSIIVVPRIISSNANAKDARGLIVDLVINNVYNQLFVWLGIVAFAVFALILNWITFRKIPVNTSI